MNYTSAAIGMLITLTSGLAYASGKSAFCQKVKSPELFQRSLESADNRLSFTNYGGLVNGGVCWWHSMFTKRATYLAVYRPDLPRPTNDEAKRIISSIISGRSIVIIPGFANLRSFSWQYDSDIQKALEQWQIRDGAIAFGWVRGLQGKTEVSERKMQREMDELYDLVKNQKEITYQKLQMPGIVAHAWLVIDMKKTSQGYEIIVVDSNYNSTSRYTYRYGDTNMWYSGFGQFVPYTSRNGDYNRMRSAQVKYCQGGETQKPQPRNTANRDRRNHR